MKLILQGKPKKNFIVYSIKPRKIGEPVEVYSNGVLVQTGNIIADMSTESKYLAKKRIGSNDVEFNAGRGYYKVRMR